MADFTPWLLVGAPENVAKSHELGWRLQGVKHTQRKKALEIKPGDRLIYYVTGAMKLVAITEVTGELFESHDKLWPCSKPREDGGDVYPYRFEIKPFLVAPDEAAWLNVRDFRQQLTYLEKWPEKNWTLGFQGNLHRWPMADYQLVETMARNAAWQRI